MGSRVLGFLNLMTACKMIVKSGDAQSKTRRRPASAEKIVGSSSSSGSNRGQKPPASKGVAIGDRPAASPRVLAAAAAAAPARYAVGRDPAEQYELRDDDLSVLEAILSASASQASACEAAQGMEQILAAFSRFLDQLPSTLKTGPGATMARPHVMRKHLLVQNKLHPNSIDWYRTTWDQMNLAFPDVGQHLAREGIPTPLYTPGRVAAQMHVPLELMSMHLCLTHEAVVALRNYQGRGQEDAVQFICISRVDDLIRLRAEYREANGHNPNAATLVRLSAVAAGLAALPQAPESQLAAVAAQPDDASFAAAAASAPTSDAPLPWKELLNRHRSDSGSRRASDRRSGAVSRRPPGPSLTRTMASSSTPGAGPAPLRRLKGKQQRPVLGVRLRGEEGFGSREDLGCSYLVLKVQGLVFKCNWRPSEPKVIVTADATAAAFLKRARRVR